MPQDWLSDIEISRKDFVTGRDLTERADGLTPSQVRDLVVGLAGDHVTVSVCPAEGQRLLIAVSDADAFVALESGPQIYQFARAGAGPGSHEMVIEGQQTQLESRFVLTVRQASAAVHEWLSGAEPLSIGAWEQM